MYRRIPVDDVPETVRSVAELPAVAQLQRVRAAQISDHIAGRSGPACRIGGPDPRSVVERCRSWVCRGSIGGDPGPMTGSQVAMRRRRGLPVELRLRQPEHGGRVVDDAGHRVDRVGEQVAGPVLIDVGGRELRLVDDGVGVGPVEFTAAEAVDCVASRIFVMMLCRSAVTAPGLLSPGKRRPWFHRQPPSH